MENGKYKTRKFTSKDDIWDVINLLVEETESFNKKGIKRFNVANSVFAQLPFFSCTNNLLDQKSQNDIYRYFYCEKFKTPAYKGSYGEQPKKWIEKSMFLTEYISKRKSGKVEKNNG